MSNLKVTVYCPYCERHTALQIAPTLVDRGYEKVRGHAVWEKSDRQTWWIGVCNYCHEPLLVCNNGEHVFPYPFPSKTDSRIPEEIKQDLVEAKVCFSVKAYRGAAVMARRSIQATCISKGAKKSKLVDQLEELTSNGTITKDLFEWASVVRWVGNDAAHPNKDIVSKDDAEDILNLAEQFLHVIFVAPAIAKERRAIKGR